MKKNKNAVYMTLCGSGGTGKGTLAKAISCEYKITFIPSKIKEIGLYIFPESQSYKNIAEDVTSKIAFQYAILTSQVEREFMLREHGISYISERNIIDYYVYMKRFEEENKEKINKGQKECINRYYKYVERTLDDLQYDHILYLPKEFENTEQDLKENSWKDRNDTQIADEFAKVLNYFKEKFELPVVTLTGSVEERMKQVEQII